MIHVSIANQQSGLELDEQRLTEAITEIVQLHGPPRVEVSLAVVDDATIHQLNRQYLDHDYPTDVLSFVLQQDSQQLEGEIIVSSEMAIATALEYDWPADHELLLYVIHGALHLVGFADKTPEEVKQMRAEEAEALGRFGIRRPAERKTRAASTPEPGTSSDPTLAGDNG